MKSIKFKGSNCVYAEFQDQYLNLPGHKTPGGEVITCWSLTFKERLKLLFVGKIWLGMLTFNKPLQPIKMSTEKPIYLKAIEQHKGKL